VEQRAKAGAVRAALASFFGGAPTLQCEGIDEGDGAPLSPGEQARADAAERKAEREETARNHPKVQLTQALFPGAEITAVRHLTEK